MARKKCEDCHRPTSHCLCSFIDRQLTKLPILIFQHPDESNHPFTTAYLADLGASSVQLRCGLSIDETECKDLLGLSSLDKLALLYAPHHYEDHETIRVDCSSADSALSASISGLIVLDGTWRNTRELLLRNTWMAKLAVLNLENAGVTEYTVRKNVKDNAVSTIEAVGKSLVLCDPEFMLDTYLAPMRELVRQQLQFKTFSGTDDTNSRQ